jgi:aryl-alcohol dehydrogenase-like predicted oxidoreductase
MSIGGTGELMTKLISRREFLTISGSAAICSTVRAQTQIREMHRGGMLYRRLGKSDLFVSALGFGSHTDPRYRQPDPKGSRLSEEGQTLRDHQLETAIDLGLNLIDVYDDASQWNPAAKVVHGKRDRVLISLRLNELPGDLIDFVDRGARLFGHIDLCRFVVPDQPGPKVLEDWDVLRKAKATGKIRAIGIAAHDPEALSLCLRELEGLDFVMFPYNFIHARVSYSDFLPAAIQSGVGLVAIKPLAAGSIVALDPNRPRPRAKPEGESLSLHTFRRNEAPLLEQAVARLASEIDRSPDDTLAQAALRFVWSKPFIACALTGLFLEEELTENHQALVQFTNGRRAQHSVLEAARELAALRGCNWVPSDYRWLDQKWKTERRRS